MNPVHIEVDSAAVRAMLARVRTTFDPRRFGLAFHKIVRRRFLAQVQQAFSDEGPQDGGAWAPLSEMRVAIRGTDHPILDDTGEFKDEALRYKGRLTLIADEGFSLWFPYGGEVSPLFWGLTAGQRVNPLGLRPLALTPRPLFGGVRAQERDTVDTIADYLRAEGFDVELENG